MSGLEGYFLLNGVFLSTCRRQHDYIWLLLSVSPVRENHFCSDTAWDQPTQTMLSVVVQESEEIANKFCTCATSQDELQRPGASVSRPDPRLVPAMAAPF